MAKATRSQYLDAGSSDLDALATLASGKNPDGTDFVFDVASTPPTTSTATHSNVVAASADTLLLALNTSRKGAMFFNDSDKVLYLKFGSGASATSFTVKIAVDGYFELPSPIFTGLIHGFWAAGPTGSCRVTELS